MTKDSKLIIFYAFIFLFIYEADYSNACCDTNIKTKLQFDFSTEIVAIKLGVSAAICCRIHEPAKFVNDPKFHR